MLDDRSIRRFERSEPVEKAALEEAVSLATLCASGRNLMPLRYRIITDARTVAAICTHLKWAGYLADWDGPEESELPGAIICQYLDTRLTANPMCDEGLQLQAISLGLTALGLGACIIKSFDKAEVDRLAGVGEPFDLRYVLAVGHPAEKVVIEEIDTSLDADVKYWRDGEGVHHVPKRTGIII